LLLCVVLLASCGGDAAKARGYVSEGDALLVKVQPVSLKLSKDISSLFGGVFSGGKVDASAFSSGAVKVREGSDKMLAGAESAKKKYAQVDGLKDVPYYRQYAEYQLKIIELNKQGIGSLKAFLDEWVPAVSSPVFDPVAFVNASRDLSDKADQTAAAIEKLEKQAAALKKDKKI
jgi:hypothetical protein